MDVIVTIGFALFLCAGAFFGLRAGSRKSLVMGIASGCLALLCVPLLETQPTKGLLLLAILCGILAFIFLKRLKQTKKFMPAGMLFNVTLVFEIYYFIRLILING